MKTSLKNSISIDFPRMNEQFNDQSPKMSRANNEKARSKRRSYHNERKQSNPN